MLIEGTKVTVPCAADAPDKTFDLEKIFQAEAREGEIAIVSPVKAPELLSLFNKAWLDTDKIVKELVETRVKIENEVAKRKATIQLYEAKAFLKEQGIESTKDTRDAVITLDPEFQRLQERVDQLTAVIEWLKGKMKFFENLFTSVKKVMGEDAYNMSTRVGNKNLSHGTPPAPPQGPAIFHRPSAPEPVPTTKPSSGYGKSRYDR